MIRVPRTSPLAAAVAVALLCLVAAGAFALADIGEQRTEERALVVADADSDDRLTTIPVDDGTVVALEYVHSVEQTDVRDEYVVNGSAIEMTRTEFDAFGAGLPTDAERTDDGYVAYRNQTYERLYVSPSGHELVVDGERHDLDDLSDGGSVELRIEAPTRGDSDAG